MVVYLPQLVAFTFLGRWWGPVVSTLSFYEYRLCGGYSPSETFLSNSLPFSLMYQLMFGTLMIEKYNKNI